MAKINEKIIGYEYVKNVVAITPIKAKKQEYMFVVRKSAGRDLLTGMVRVLPYSEEQFWRTRSELSWKIYRIYVGEIINAPNGKSTIRLY